MVWQGATLPLYFKTALKIHCFAVISVLFLFAVMQCFSNCGQCTVLDEVRISLKLPLIQQNSPTVPGHDVSVFCANHHQNRKLQMCSGAHGGAVAVIGGL